MISSLKTTSGLVALIALSASSLFAQESGKTAKLADAAEKSKPAVADNAPTPIDGYVYVDALPTPTQLSDEADREGLIIKRMERSPGRIVVVYEYSDGRTRAFAYSTTSLDTVARPTTPSPTVVYRDAEPRTTVIYTEPERVIYYERPTYIRSYEPVRDFWAPVSIGVGLGFGFGHHHHHHGGFRGGWRR
ncbi:hypothetical protein [Oleiharenicola lentus]|uniref:hypothetical protein n=1 Tax=Oleiharenicola lentus TaxID=2508720 RepID=UPI003F66396D